MEWVLYVDMDAFYVNCELLEREELRGRPVIVGHEPGETPTRAVVLSASYEARPSGVRSAMPVREAKRRCPDAVWITPHFSEYERRSKEVMRWLSGRFGSARPQSIDEAIVRATAPDASAAGEVARATQADLGRATRLPSSWGGASHRLLAKMASDRAKPGGVLIVPPSEAAEFVAPLPVRSVPGVGPKSAERLAGMGIRTIGDLVARRKGELRREFGGWGETLVELARGELAPDVDLPEESGPLSRSTDFTFEQDTDDLARLVEAVDRLSGDLQASLAREGLRYRAVGVGIRWADFQRVQRVRALPGAVSDLESLRTAAHRLLRELWEEEVRGGAREVRTVTVRIERLSPAVPRQASLDGFAPGNDVTEWLKSGPPPKKDPAA